MTARLRALRFAHGAPLPGQPAPGGALRCETETGPCYSPPGRALTVGGRGGTPLHVLTGHRLTRRSRMGLLPTADRLSPWAFRARLLLLLILSLAAGAAALLLPRFAQPQWYHDFADQRPLLGIPHALNVLSNLPFVAVGVLGVLFVASPAARRPGGPFLEASERRAFAVFFAAVALTGIGSAYYHAEPGNDRLLWDRLPLAVAFMALFAATIAERISVR